MFRPCIDLHEGKVKQIVGSTLRDDAASAPVTNFESDRPSRWYAELYKRDKLRGGHIIMLGPGNDAAARQALAAWPGGMQIGGGINSDNARSYLDAGASHVIVTSWAFHGGRIDFDRLSVLTRAIGEKRLVLDLSCRIRDGRYYVVTDRWQKFTDVEVNEDNLARLALWCDEFLVHAVDVEGKCEGVDFELVERLGRYSPIPSTYAGGARSLDDLRQVHERGRRRVGLTIGSALDIFGGPIKYADVVALNRTLG
jgi:phosphoribosylformimino-5-aminoimidazole carboxamide ribotide isomerase